jgi:hypothetical protein
MRHLDELAVAAQADRGPNSNPGVGAEHRMGYFEGDGEDVFACECVLPGPLESMPGSAT